MGGNRMKRIPVTFVAIAVLVFLKPLVARGQGLERISLGAKAAAWIVPDLDDFSLILDGLRGPEVYETDESVLLGIRPFARLGLTQNLALEISHEFAFSGDSDVMVTSGTGIWRPFSRTGLEFHASICYGQFDWNGPGDVDHTWGWEAGASYRLELTESVCLIAGIAYRDLTFDFDVEGLFTDLAETRPDVAVVSFSQESIDASGAVADIGISVRF